MRERTDAWTPGGVSDDIEDRRDDDGDRGPGALGGFGGFGGFHLGIGGTLLLLVLGFVFRHSLFTGSPASPHPVRSSGSRTGNPEKEVQFVSFVIDNVQHTWDKLLPEQQNVPYHHAKLVLSRRRTHTSRSMASGSPIRRITLERPGHFSTSIRAKSDVPLRMPRSQISVSFPVENSDLGAT